MKNPLLMLMTFMSILISSASSCNKEDDIKTTENNTPMVNEKIKITVNSQAFTATLLDNNSAKV